jgi:hypothetical protein
MDNKKENHYQKFCDSDPEELKSLTELWGDPFVVCYTNEDYESKAVAFQKSLREYFGFKILLRHDCMVREPFYVIGSEVFQLETSRMRLGEAWDETFSKTFALVTGGEKEILDKLRKGDTETLRAVKKWWGENQVVFHKEEERNAAYKNFLHIINKNFESLSVSTHHIDSFLVRRDKTLVRTDIMKIWLGTVCWGKEFILEKDPIENKEALGTYGYNPYSGEFVPCIPFPPSGNNKITDLISQNVWEASQVKTSFVNGQKICVLYYDLDAVPNGSFAYKELMEKYPDLKNWTVIGNFLLLMTRTTSNINLQLKDLPKSQEPQQFRIVIQKKITKTELEKLRRIQRNKIKDKK